MGRNLTRVQLAAAELERRRRVAQAVKDSGGESIPADMSFRSWCQLLADNGMKIDGKPFDLSNRAALEPLYAAIPTTREAARGRRVVVQKATQLGMTVWEILAMVYMAIKFGPVNIGLFLPDQSSAAFKSEHRFMRIIRSVPDLLRRLVYRKDGGKDTRVGEGNILTRVMGESIFMFLWTTGKVTTESRPMDIIGLDEVQEMALDHIDKVLMRLGDSDIDFVLMLSTANMPEADINYWYALGTQEVWHSRCDACGALSDLSDPAGIFPDRSVAFNAGQIAGAPVGEYVWVCPECGAWIPDPQHGELVVTNPGGQHQSLLMPRTISPKNRLATKMFEGWSRAKTAGQKKSFYNRALARPYIDADQLPVTMAHCLAAVEAGRLVGVKWKTSAKNTFMGIDQMGSFNVAIIKERLPDGRQATIHVEAVFSDDPFARCSELMVAYGVAVCVVEQLPNVNDARRFANKFPGRIFLAGYSDLRDDSMLWSDDLTKSDRRTADDEQTRYTVVLNQYKCMQTSLYRIRGAIVDGKLVPMCLFPDPDDLIQDVIQASGKRERIPLLRDWVFLHFTKTALVVEEDDEERKKRAKVMKVGIDPHFSFANMLCDVAWARAYGTSTFIFPEADVKSKVQETVEKHMPGLPSGVMAMLDAPRDGTCGKCSAYKEGTCSERGFTVNPGDPACEIYDAAS
jgi:hypothetical protein